MFKGFYNLTSAMITQGKNLDVISNNITNASTAGYKVDTFTATTFDTVMWERVGNKYKEYTDIGEQSFITAPSDLYTDFSQNGFDETGLPLDFAIEGDGFFAIETDAGIQYTRDGSFSLDDEGYLYLPGQGRVLDANEQPILLVTDKLDCDNYGGLYTEDGAYLGRIGVFVFAENDQLEKNDQGLFTAAEAGEPTATTVIHNGMLERSNVDWARELTSMISAERAYQSAAEAIKMYDDVMQKATEDVGRLA